MIKGEPKIKGIKTVKSTQICIGGINRRKFGDQTTLINLSLVRNKKDGLDLSQPTLPH